MDRLNTSKTEYTLSIVVPCYNCESTLDRTVNSLLNQKILVTNYSKQTDRKTNSNYQIVLVDDGATDSTPATIDTYSEKHNLIKAIHKENGGLVSAWKAGVLNADGDYIAFCDSDDYIDFDFVNTIQGIITEHKPDIITFGMTYEYDNGEIITEDTRLEAGKYGRNQIEQNIFPILLSNGDMQSELIGSSRCNKVFKKSLLLKIIDDIPESVSFGEDDLTSFAAVLNADSIYSIQGVYPYHYIRNTRSMIGAYDDKVFGKIDKLYGELSKIADKYNYSYMEQVKNEILSILFLYIKKEICKNPNGYRRISKKIKAITSCDTFISCNNYDTIKKYGFAKRLFAFLLSSKQIWLAYIMTRGVEVIRGRNV